MDGFPAPFDPKPLSDEELQRALQEKQAALEAAKAEFRKTRDFGLRMTCMGLDRDVIAINGERTRREIAQATKKSRPSRREGR